MSELKLEHIGHPDAVSNALTFDSDGTLATGTGFSSGGLKVKSSGGGTFSINPPSSATDRTLTLPDEAGTVLTSASNISSQATQNVPAFSVKLSATYSGWSLNTINQMPFDTEDLDTDSWFNTTTYRFTPQTAGWYNINFMWGVGSGLLQAMFAYIRKNGSVVSQASYYDASAGALDDFHIQANKLIYLNGSTDYIDFAFNQVGGNTNVSASPDVTYAEGFLVRAT